MNYLGFNPKLEEAHQSDTDWFKGTDSDVGLVYIPESERGDYLPIGEVQGVAQDTSDCATRSPANGYEIQFTYLYRNDKLKPENKKWLDDNGYVTVRPDLGHFIQFSDAFNAILSGTTRDGNSLKAPLDSMRKDGMIPNSKLPLEPWMLWEDYHDPRRITQELRDLGLEFARRFTLNYEKVLPPDFEETLKTDIICTAGHAWPVPVNGEYPRTDKPFNHAFLLWLLPKFHAFDSYTDVVDGDFIKKLAPDFRFYDYGYRIYVSSEITPEQRAIQQGVFDILLTNGLLAFFADWWERFSRNVKGLWN